LKVWQGLVMRTASIDLRERILASYDNEEGTRAEIAHRFRVSLGLVKKLLQQRRRTGDIAPRHRFAGRKPLIVAAHQSQMRALLAKKSDLTLKELRTATGLKCSLQAINVVLGRLGLTYKKRHSAPASRIVRTLPGRGGFGGGSKPASTRHA
jgi:transposase